MIKNKRPEDYTELKKAEAALRLTEDKFSKAFHNNQTMMAIMRFKDRVLIDVNDEFAGTVLVTRL